ncbi:MAG: LON peptidase substrate-binding domain-containing protein [Bacteroidota bacterium]
MNQTLAFFPLQLVVFPGEPLNLHIFEPRYRQLVTDAESEGITFGIPTVIKGEICPLATEVRLQEVSKRYPSGESDVKTVGQRLFRIQTFEPKLGKKLYAGGEVEFIDIDTAESIDLNEEIVMLITEIYKVLNIDKVIKPAKAGFRTYDIAHYVGMSLEQEYEFLSLINAQDRQYYLLQHLRQIRPDVTRRLDIKARAKMNGHFKELVPPQF